jgi:hypothetical protein
MWLKLTSNTWAQAILCLTIVECWITDAPQFISVFIEMLAYIKYGY